jgi:hypothetical protein
LNDETANAPATSRGNIGLPGRKGTIIRKKKEARPIASEAVYAFILFLA